MKFWRESMAVPAMPAIIAVGLPMISRSPESEQSVPPSPYAATRPKVRTQVEPTCDM